MICSEYNLITPKNLKQVLSMIHKEPGVWRPFAGGTDIMVEFKSGRLKHKNYISISNLKELSGITIRKDEIILGANVTYADIMKCKVIAESYPLLLEAANITGARAIQNRGTMGGNIANASPAADTLPALLVYDAFIEAVSLKKSRLIPYGEFHIGYKKTALNSEEIIKSVKIKKMDKHLISYYRKVGTRKSQAISKVVFAGIGFMNNTGLLENVKIAVGSVAPVPIRLIKTESLINGQKPDPEMMKQAKEILKQEIVPIDDVRSTSKYRKAVTSNLFEEFIERLGQNVELDH